MSLALDDLDAEIRVMQAEKVERQQQQVCEAMDQVRLGRDPFGCLPMQSQSSLELHSAIVEHYSNRHQIGKEISSVSRRQARRQRKAKAKGADYADRNTSSIACKLSKRKRRQQLK
ncbi:Uncharacterized protein PBTT_09294 [Plasmodiophora brassicae]|uniref:Uncharacterized protein n=1 Tax=Plasmodiophora brassicae TaxID=37360 RepID=A0A0G4IPE0_PLABS|nr:hypothetical protein PBRA_005737 [Plasmodiophora brassicae]SPR01110.1 unnamed protein product [Plasmodiophora brassicae]